LPPFFTLPGVINFFLIPTLPQKWRQQLLIAGLSIS